MSFPRKRESINRINSDLDPRFRGDDILFMVYIFFALFLFITSVMAHLFFCRTTSKSGLHAKAFVLMAIISLGIYVAFVLVWQYSGAFDPRSIGGIPFRITAGTIYILLVPIYLCFYVLTQLTSPSKKILLAVSQRGELSRADILASVQEEDFIATRLKDLCDSGCVKHMDGRYIITPEGRKIAAILNLMQSILGRDPGG